MSPSGKAWVCKTLIHRFDSGHGLVQLNICPGGGMVYAKDLKSFASNGLRVRVPPRAQEKTALFIGAALIMRIMQHHVLCARNPSD